MKYYPYIFLLLASSLVNGQDFQSRIYDCYLQSRMDTWKVVIDQMTRQYQSTGDMTLLYELTEAEYGYIGYCVSSKRKKEAREMLNMVEKQIELLLVAQKNNSRALSLSGAFYGLRIQLEPLKIARLGKKSEEANQMAIEADPEEPQAWMEKANIAFYKPAFVGGSKSEAVLLYEKAVQLFEANPERTRKNWLYLNCLAGLGLAYEETDQIQKAGKVYEKLLHMEPTFGWVRDDLYPQFLEKHASN